MGYQKQLLGIMVVVMIFISNQEIQTIPIPITSTTLKPENHKNTTNETHSFDPSPKDTPPADMFQDKNLFHSTQIGDYASSINNINIGMYLGKIPDMQYKFNRECDDVYLKTIGRIVEKFRFYTVCPVVNVTLDKIRTCTAIKDPEDLAITVTNGGFHAPIWDTHVISGPEPILIKDYDLIYQMFNISKDRNMSLTILKHMSSGLKQYYYANSSHLTYSGTTLKCVSPTPCTYSRFGNLWLESPYLTPSSLTLVSSTFQLSYLYASTCEMRGSISFDKISKIISYYKNASGATPYKRSGSIDDIINHRQPKRSKRSDGFPINNEPILTTPAIDQVYREMENEQEQTRKNTNRLIEAIHLFEKGSEQYLRELFIEEELNKQNLTLQGHKTLKDFDLINTDIEALTNYLLKGNTTVQLEKEKIIKRSNTIKLNSQETHLNSLFNITSNNDSQIRIKRYVMSSLLNDQKSEPKPLITTPIRTVTTLHMDQVTPMTTIDSSNILPLNYSIMSDGKKSKINMDFLETIIDAHEKIHGVSYKINSTLDIKEHVKNITSTNHDGSQNKNPNKQKQMKKQDLTYSDYLQYHTLILLVSIDHLDMDECFKDLPVSQCFEIHRMWKWSRSSHTSPLKDFEHLSLWMMKGDAYLESVADWIHKLIPVNKRFIFGAIAIGMAAYNSHRIGALEQKMSHLEDAVDGLQDAVVGLQTQFSTFQEATNNVLQAHNARMDALQTSILELANYTSKMFQIVNYQLNAVSYRIAVTEDSVYGAIQMMVGNLIRNSKETVDLLTTITSASTVLELEIVISQLLVGRLSPLAVSIQDFDKALYSKQLRTLMNDKHVDYKYTRENLPKLYESAEATMSVLTFGEHDNTTNTTKFHDGLMVSIDVPTYTPSQIEPVLSVIPIKRQQLTNLTVPLYPTINTDFTEDKYYVAYNERLKTYRSIPVDHPSCTYNPQIHCPWTIVARKVPSLVSSPMDCLIIAGWIHLQGGTIPDNCTQFWTSQEPMTLFSRVPNNCVYLSAPGFDVTVLKGPTQDVKVPDDQKGLALYCENQGTYLKAGDSYFTFDVDSDYTSNETFKINTTTKVSGLNSFQRRVLEAKSNWKKAMEQDDITRGQYTEILAFPPVGGSPLSPETRKALIETKTYSDAQSVALEGVIADNKIREKEFNASITESRNALAKSREITTDGLSSTITKIVIIIIVMVVIAAIIGIIVLAVYIHKRRQMSKKLIKGGGSAFSKALQMNNQMNNQYQMNEQQPYEEAREMYETPQL